MVIWPVVGNINSTQNQISAFNKSMHIISVPNSHIHSSSPLALSIASAIGRSSRVVIFILFRPHSMSLISVPRFSTRELSSVTVSPSISAFLSANS